MPYYSRRSAWEPTKSRNSSSYARLSANSNLPSLSPPAITAMDRDMELDLQTPFIRLSYAEAGKRRARAATEASANLLTAEKNYVQFNATPSIKRNCAAPSPTLEPVLTALGADSSTTT
jgi:hypothetical protein